MNAKECIMGRRSIRSFTEAPVSHELISEIVEAASYAPSWKHTQIVRYIAVEGDLKDQVAKCTSAYPHNGEIIASAPMVIAVTIIKGRSGYERDGSFSTHRGDGSAGESSTSRNACHGSCPSTATSTRNGVYPL